jgi:hypothetical protein
MMRTTRHAVDVADTRQALDVRFRYARAHDVKQGGRYGARLGGGQRVVASMAERCHL